MRLPEASSSLTRAAAPGTRAGADIEDAEGVEDERVEFITQMGEIRCLDRGRRKLGQGQPVANALVAFQNQAGVDKRRLR